MDKKQVHHNLSVNKLFEVNKFFLKCTGTYLPEYQQMPLYSSFKSYFCMFINIIFFILQLIGALMIANSEIMPEKKIIHIISETKKLDELPAINSEERKIARFWKINRNRLVMAFKISYLVLTISYFVAALLTKDNSLPFKLIFKSNTFFTPWYEIIYSLELFFFIFTLSVMISSDLICITLICQLCMELQIIQLLLKNSYNTDEFISVIKKHIRILKYGEDICEQLSGNILTQYTFLFFIASIANFIAQITNESALKNKMLWLIFMVLFILLIICISGESITNTSEAVASILAQSNLIADQNENRLKIHKMLIFVLMRAQKPLKLSVGTIGRLNLYFYTSTIKNMYSIFMLLTTIYS